MCICNSIEAKNAEAGPKPNGPHTKSFASEYQNISERNWSPIIFIMEKHRGHYLLIIGTNKQNNEKEKICPQAGLNNRPYHLLVLRVARSTTEL